MTKIYPKNRNRGDLPQFDEEHLQKFVQLTCGLGN